MPLWIPWTLVFLAGVGFFAWQIYGRFGVLLKARKDDGRDYSSKTWGIRFKNTLVYAFGQYKFFRDDQPAGWMHIVVFWGFLVLSLQVVTMFSRGWFPGFKIPLFGGWYAFMRDIFQAGVLIGVAIALFRWLVTKPTRLFGFLPAEKRLREHSHWEAILILSFIATIMLSGFFYDAGRLEAMASDAEILDEGRWQPITRWIAGFFAGHPDTAETVASVAWWVHNLVILCFLNLLPRSKHFHIITAIPNVFLGKVEPTGALAKRDFTVDEPLFGRSLTNHFTWKQMLDMYSCTECGRCSSFCPATATGKPLAPRQFLLNLRDTLYSDQPKFLAVPAQASTTPQPEGVSPDPVSAERSGDGYQMVIGDDKPVIDEVVWSCVTCRACEEHCPVNIEYVDKIVDIRQHLTQEASRFPEELNRAFKGMENNSNPWGIGADERAAWADGLDVPLISQKPDVEYLYYVGCGGSFDSNNRKATQSFVKILKEAGVSFAILGKEELCNGDSARRLGNEYLFQTMAEALATTINGYNVKKILVNCPHCFNTLKNEYPQFGGNWQVEHAAALVGRLVAEGKVKLGGKYDKTVVYHDSCYYGRYNDIYDEPRNLISEIDGAKLEEMFYCKRQGTCCGAGGGRMWMEEKADQRVNILRTDQALEKKPDVVATSCPYCRIMIGSGVNEKGVSDKVEVLDVMEIVEKNMTPKGPTPATAPA